MGAAGNFPGKPDRWRSCQKWDAIIAVDRQFRYKVRSGSGKTHDDWKLTGLGNRGNLPGLNSVYIVPSMSDDSKASRRMKGAMSNCGLGVMVKT